MHENHVWGRDVDRDSEPCIGDIVSAIGGGKLLGHHRRGGIHDKRDRIIVGDFRVVGSARPTGSTAGS